jgi:hypothetical protein
MMEKKLQARILSPAKPPFKIIGEIETFSYAKDEEVHKAL